jgi:hypothetical protein
MEKTKCLRAMPRHLKYTLFNNENEKIKNLRKSKDLFLVFYISGDIKKHASRLIKKKQFREAIDLYSEVNSFNKI